MLVFRPLIDKEGIVISDDENDAHQNSPFQQHSFINEDNESNAKLSDKSAETSQQQLEAGDATITVPMKGEIVIVQHFIQNKKRRKESEEKRATEEKATMEQLYAMFENEIDRLTLGIYDTGMHQKLRDNHSDIFPHRCHHGTCEKGYMNRQHLLRHFRTEHGRTEHPHVCDKCPLAYRDGWRLRRHVKMIHREVVTPTIVEEEVVIVPTTVSGKQTEKPLHARRHKRKQEPCQSTRRKQSTTKSMSN